MLIASEKPHAELGASKWKTWGTCPGSVPLGEGIPSSSSSYAKEGNAAHALLEEVLLTGKDAEDYLGEEIEVEGSIYTVDMEMADAINWTVAQIAEVIDPARGDVLLVEQEVPLQQLTGEEGAVGTSDVVGIVDDGKGLVVADLKYGKGVQEWAQEYAPMKGAVPNGQLAIYGSASLHQIAMMYPDIEMIRLMILQPRIDDGHVDTFDISVEDLRKFEVKVGDAAGRVELAKLAMINEGVGGLDLVPSEGGCRFCKAKHRCPALVETATNAIATVSSAEDFDDLSLPKKAASVVVDAEVTPERLSEIMRAIPLIEEMMKAVRAEVERRLLAGQTVPGYYLGQGKAGNRKWADDDEAFALLKKKKKLDEIAVIKPISPTQAEKVFKDKPRIWSQFVPLITQSAGGPSVCRDGDKNPPYVLASDVSEFDVIDAETAALMS